MKNKWKTAFWILSGVFIIVTCTLLYAILDQGVTLTYMKEGYEDTENDLKQLSRVIEGKLVLEDFKALTDNAPYWDDSTQIILNRTRVLFDSNKKVRSITTDF